MSLAALLALSMVCIAAVRTTALLVWDYPTGEATNVSFNVFFTTNIAAPGWSFVTNVTGTTATVNILPGNGFWIVTATNEWGESIPSNVAGVTVARNVTGLRAK